MVTAWVAAKESGGKGGGEEGGPWGHKKNNNPRTPGGGRSQEIIKQQLVEDRSCFWGMKGEREGATAAASADEWDFWLWL